MSIRHFLDIAAFNSAFITSLIDTAIDMKKTSHRSAVLKEKTVALLFEKPSLRTRVSFEVGIRQLGGHVITLNNEEVGLGKRESVEDVARVLSRYVDMVVIRTFSHDTLKRLSQHTSMPVINALTDHSHPCQAIADAITIKEQFHDLTNKTVVYFGDENNVSQSLNELCQLTHMKFILCSPVPPKNKQVAVHYEPDPVKAIRQADVIYTDTWVSMGQRVSQTHLNALKPYQLNATLFNQAKETAILLHCLPAHRGEEITNDVLESTQSKVFDQAENRLHAQKAIMTALLQ